MKPTGFGLARRRDETAPAACVAMLGHAVSGRTSLAPSVGRGREAALIVIFMVLLISSLGAISAAQALAAGSAPSVDWVESRSGAEHRKPQYQGEEKMLFVYPTKVSAEARVLTRLSQCQVAHRIFDEQERAGKRGRNRRKQWRTQT